MLIAGAATAGATAGAQKLLFRWYEGIKDFL
jgi:hypothetical protein